MPRVLINKPKYMVSDFTAWVIGRMKIIGVTQTDLANEFKVTQPAISQKIKNASFDYKELIKLFQILQADETDITRLMKL